MITRRGFVQRALAIAGTVLGARALPASMLARRPLAISACQAFEPLPLASDKVYIIKAVRCVTYFQNLNDAEYAEGVP